MPAGLLFIKVEYGSFDPLRGIYALGVAPQHDTIIMLDGETKANIHTPLALYIPLASSGRWGAF